MKLLLPTFAFWLFINDITGIVYMLLDDSFRLEPFLSVTLIQMIFAAYILYFSRSLFDTRVGYLKGMGESLARSFLIIVFTTIAMKFI